MGPLEGFGPADRGLQTSEKLNPEGDGSFNPRIKPTKSMGALAPGCRWCINRNYSPAFDLEALGRASLAGCGALGAGSIVASQ